MIQLIIKFLGLHGKAHIKHENQIVDNMKVMGI